MQRGVVSCTQGHIGGYIRGKGCSRPRSGPAHLAHEVLEIDRCLGYLVAGEPTGVFVGRLLRQEI